MMPFDMINVYNNKRDKCGYLQLLSIVLLEFLNSTNISGTLWYFIEELSKASTSLPRS